MSGFVIKAEQISKKFILSHEAQERYSSMRDAIAKKAKQLIRVNRKTNLTKEEFYALKDVSFDISMGDRLGIIGHNGAGKSTLLKLLSRITEPTSGRIVIRGRVASLLEVGTGFHPELTGRENIFLNGAILGMGRSEIKRKFDEIVAFAEIEKFLDTPVKRYSSGMYVRLAFAVAAHLEPEILIVDEVLAVGDAQFQKKCLGKMEDISKNQGKTVLFVSHNMASLKSLCDKGIYLKSGMVNFAGNIQDTINQYLDSSSGDLSNSISNRRFFDNLLLEQFTIDKYAFSIGEDMRYSIKIKADDTTINNLCLLIYNSINDRVAIVDLRHTDFVGKRMQEGILVEGAIKGINFIEGTYRIGIFISNNSESSNFFDLIKFEVVDSPADFIKYPKEVRGVVELANDFSSINVR